MISPEQLAEALQRLDPRDRELLSLSLHRRVPDEALARMYQYETSEVSRRRAAAIERLADDLRVQRGEDLGSVLKALLEPGTWSGIESSPGREFEQSGPRPAARAARGNQAVQPAHDPDPPPAPVPLRPVPSPVEPPSESEPTPEPAPAAATPPRPPTPRRRRPPRPLRCLRRRSRPVNRCSTCSPMASAGGASGRAPARGGGCWRWPRWPPPRCSGPPG